MNDFLTDYAAGWRGLTATWHSLDMYVQIVVTALVILQLLSVHALIHQLVDLSVWHIRGRRALKKVDADGNVEELIQSLDEEKEYRTVAQVGLTAASEWTGLLTERTAYHDWLNASVAGAATQAKRKIPRGLGLLPTAGALAPLLGLIGATMMLYQGLVNAADPLAPGRYSPAAMEFHTQSSSTDPREARFKDLNDEDVARVAHALDDQAYREGDLYRMIARSLWPLILGLWMAVLPTLFYWGLRSGRRRVEAQLDDFAGDVIHRLLRAPSPGSTPAPQADEGVSSLVMS